MRFASGVDLHVFVPCDLVKWSHKYASPTLGPPQAHSCGDPNRGGFSALWKAALTPQHLGLCAFVMESCLLWEHFIYRSLLPGTQTGYRPLSEEWRLCSLAQPSSGSRLHTYNMRENLPSEGEVGE